VAEQVQRAAGNIYDLGYRPYEGERLGRRYAIVSLFWYSLRAVFGLGRSAWSKVFAWGLAVIAALPALVQLAIAALAPADFELVAPEDYFGYVQIVLALFCAIGSPEIVGRDQRNRTLALYFSRALSRADYVAAKLGALTLALTLVLLAPQILLLLGNAVATDDLTKYLQDNVDLIPPILASCLMVGAFMSSVSLAIASQTSRRAFATGAVLMYFVISTAVGAILVETVTGDARMYSVLVSPVATVEGAVLWLFGGEAPIDSAVAKSGLDGPVFFLVTLAYTSVAAGLLFRRFQRMNV
jgi:ABC-2 type transport system permease protein